jgi:hypothetical protein
MEAFLERALSLGTVISASLIGVLFLLFHYFLHPKSEFSQFPRVGEGEATLYKALLDGYMAVYDFPAEKKIKSRHLMYF